MSTTIIKGVDGIQKVSAKRGFLFLKSLLLYNRVGAEGRESREREHTKVMMVYKSLSN